MAMKIANLGQADRVARSLSGVILVIAPFTGIVEASSILGLGSMVVGAVCVSCVLFCICA